MRRPRWARDLRWSGTGRAVVDATPPARDENTEGSTDDRAGGGAEVIGVGDVRMVRTFRIGPGGQLYPVNSATAWSEGWNTAACNRDRPHRPPDAGCRCGFYLYSDPAYVLAQPPSRQVLAVVAVNGTMEAGSRGARVERARIEAIWLGRRVSDRLAAAVSARYRSVAVYRDRAAMYAEHPLTRLEFFQPARVGEQARRRLRAVMWTVLAAAAVIGCLPTRTVVTSVPGAVVWLSVLAAGLATALVGLGQRSSVLALQGVGVVAWLVTADPETPVEWFTRTVFALLMVWVMLIWWRAATPGRRVRRPRVEQAVRRWRGQLPGTR